MKVSLFLPTDLVGAVNRPKAWPSLRYHSSEFLERVRHCLKWKVVRETNLSNRGANLISQSVTNDMRLQSYVALGYPRWLSGLFEEGRVQASI